MRESFHIRANSFALIALVFAILLFIPHQEAFASNEATNSQLSGTVEFEGRYHPGDTLTAKVTLDPSCSDASLIYQWFLADDAAFTQNVQSISNGNDNTIQISTLWDHKYLKVEVTSFMYSGSLTKTTGELTHPYWLGKIQHDENECWISCPFCSLKFEREPHAFDSEITNPPSCLTEGSSTSICARCKCSTTNTIPATGHTLSNSWQSNTTHHWKDCESCGMTVEKAEHSIENGACSVCGYQETVSAASDNTSSSSPESDSSENTRDKPEYLPATNDPIKEFLPVLIVPLVLSLAVLTVYRFKNPARR